VYNPANQRVKKTAGGVTEYYMYGAMGELIGTYEIQKIGTCSQCWYHVEKHTNIYFGGKLLHSHLPPERTDVDQGNAVIVDRLGSLRKRDGFLTNYYPYGEIRTNTTGNQNLMFATYPKDTGTGLNYAMNRYYSNQWGRFLTPDPYQASAQLENPQSWNRHAYVGNDPMNFVDPSGLDVEGVGPEVIYRPEPEPYISVDYTLMAGLGLERRPRPLSEARWDGIVLSRWSLRWEAYNRRYVAQLSEAIRNLAAKCRTAFKEAGIDLNNFAAAAVSISFWDARLGADGSMLVGKISPASLVASKRLSETEFDPNGERVYAVTLDAAVEGIRTTTQTVVLHRSFFAANSLKQSNILVHEALHTFTGPWDQDLARNFNIIAGSEVEASQRLVEFLDRNCERQ
jgi:RHS repeat-associated protein